MKNYQSVQLLTFDFLTNLLSHNTNCHAGKIYEAAILVIICKVPTTVVVDSS